MVTDKPNPWADPLYPLSSPRDAGVRPARIDESDAIRVQVLRERNAVLLARVAELEGALRLHNLTPTGKVRKCLPGCIACAVLLGKP